MKRGAETFDIELGRRLRLARLRRGLSQQFVGGHLGVSFQQVQKYERGANRLSAAFLVQLRDLYEVPLGDLLPAGDAGTADLPETGRQVLRLVRDFEAIPFETIRGRLAALVRSLAADQPAEADWARRASPPNSAGTP